MLVHCRLHPLLVVLTVVVEVAASADSAQATLRKGYGEPVARVVSDSSFEGYWHSFATGGTEVTFDAYFVGKVIDMGLGKAFAAAVIELGASSFDYCQPKAIASLIVPSTVSSVRMNYYAKLVVVVESTDLQNILALQQHPLF